MALPLDASSSPPPAATPPKIAHWSVRTLLFWLVIACLLPGIIGASTFFLHEYREEQARLERDTIQTARALVQAVDNQILQVQGMARGLATSDSLTNRNFARFYERAQRTLEQSNLGATIALVNRDGRQVLNTSRPLDWRLPAFGRVDVVRRVFDTGAPVFSGVYADPVLGRDALAVAVPVLLEGKVIHALTVTILPENFTAILGALGLPSNWTGTILDSSLTIVARTREHERWVGKKPADEIFKQFSESREGIMETVLKDGVSVRTAYTSSPVTRWFVAISIPRESLNARLMRSVALLAAGIVGLFILGVGIAWFISGEITRSFRALKAPALALGSGAPVTLPAVTVKEAHEVTKAMGEAAQLLEQRRVALRQSEIRLHTLTRHAPAAIAVFDRAMRYLAVSKRWTDIFRIDEKNVIGRSHYDVFPEMPEDWKEAHRRGLAGEVLHSDGDCFVRADGTVQWSRWEIWPWNDDAGAVGGIVIAVEDVTERLESEERLRASEEKYRTLFEAMTEAFAICEIILDDQGRPCDYRHLLVNPAFERIGGYPAGSVAGKTARELVPLVEPYWIEMFGRVVLNGNPEFAEDYSAGLDKWFATRAFSLSGGKFAYLFHDITDRKLAQERIRQVSQHDPLTGLPNRALIFEYGNLLLAAARRNHSRGALLFIDLDRFKPINDLYGHETGDRVLQEVSRRLRACTREEDVVGRLGGDEFVVILPHLEPGRHRAARVAQHVVQSICQPYRINELELMLSPSIGISYFPDFASDVSTLIHTADMAMYQAKQSGRANFQFYTPEFDQRAEQALLLEVKLKEALRNGGLKLHYQPVIDLKSGALIGAEALVRLVDHDGSAIGPDKFIPIAEATGMIAELGEWVAAEACRQHKAWRGEGMELTIAINVSPVQFRQQGFADKLSDIIRSADVDPARIEIEVTESAVMENVADAVDILNRIKSLGVKVALDDFGTGYSSLSNLTSLPLDKLKVDQSFVRGIERDTASQAVTEAIIALGRNLKLEVHGEGIESEKALDYLARHGCNQAQGYWFSAPLPASEFEQWCRGHVS